MMIPVKCAVQPLLIHVSAAYTASCAFLCLPDLQECSKCRIPLGLDQGVAKTYFMDAICNQAHLLVAVY